LVRKPTGEKDSKLREVVIANFGQYTEGEQNLFKKITIDYAVAFAKALKKQSASNTLPY